MKRAGCRYIILYRGDAVIYIYNRWSRGWRPSPTSSSVCVFKHRFSFFLGEADVHVNTHPVICFDCNILMVFENTVHSVFKKKKKNFIKNYFFLYFGSFWCDDLKNNFKKIYYFDVFQHEKYFKKQPQLHT